MRLGRYEVAGELGRGGMGVVFRARAPDGREVAVKLLDKTKAKTAVQVGRFDRERRLLDALGEAEGFVPMLDSGDAPEGPFLVMPLVPGGMLRDRISRGPLPIEDAIAIVRALARATGEAHARGIVHRDLKPENVLFTKDGLPLVTDLGLAKHFRWDVTGATRSVKLSREGDLLGTAVYMAPEQIEDAVSVTPRADVFALGAILYECLAGVPAFTGETLLEVLSERVTGAGPTSLREIRPETPPWLAAIVERSLAKDPEARFADGRELARALAAPPPPPPRARRRLFVPGVALLVAGGTALVWGTWPSTPDVANPTNPIAITIEEPSAQALVIECEPFRVRGRVGTAANEVLVNGATARVDPAGTFEANVRLAPGEASILVVALGKDGARGDARRTLAPIAVPAWLRAIPESERPPVPLPARLVFGPGEREYTNVKDGSVLVFVPASPFLMGSEVGKEDERPVHEVELSAYFIGKYEVSNEEFEMFVKETKCVTTAEKDWIPAVLNTEGTRFVEQLGATWRNPRGDGRPALRGCPVVQVSWIDAQAYCRWAGLQLPTEAQWEKAAAWDPASRSVRRFSWGHFDPDARSPRVGNLADESARRRWPKLETFSGYFDGFELLSPAGAFPKGASPYGALDMMGNAAEHCEDVYDVAFYRRSPRKDPIARGAGDDRVARGSSCFSRPFCTRAQFRTWTSAGGQAEDLGFRVSRRLDSR